MKNKLPILISFAHWDDEHRAFVEKHRENLTVMIDSGAYTVWKSGGKVKLKEYLAFIDEHKHLIDEHIQLDVIGDPKGTAKNLRISRKRGYDPIPVFTIGHNTEYLHEISDGRFCCGCVKPGQDNDSIVNWILNNAKQPGRCHILGTSLVKYFRHRTPPQSIDASSWLNALRFGYCDFPISGYKEVKVDRDFLKNTSSTNYKKVERICRRHGLHLKELRDPESWKNVVDSPLRRLVLIAAFYKVKFSRETFGKDYYLAVALKSDVQMLDYAFDSGLLESIF